MPHFIIPVSRYNNLLSRFATLVIFCNKFCFTLEYLSHVVIIFCQTLKWSFINLCIFLFVTHCNTFFQKGPSLPVTRNTLLTLFSLENTDYVRRVKNQYFLNQSLQNSIWPFFCPAWANFVLKSQNYKIWCIS